MQYTKVKCTWDEDDLQRRHKLTVAPTNDEEYDDLRAYLASDNSSSEDEESISSETGPKSSASASASNKFRKLLGLAHSSDEESDDEGNKEFTYVPEKKQMLEQKIQEKVLEKEKDDEKEMTPWDKYLLKRKEKRRERRRASKAKRYQNESDISSDEDESENESESDNQKEDTNTKKTSKEELELLLAGDAKEEQSKDFNMRELIKLQTKKSTSTTRRQQQHAKKKSKDAVSVSGEEFEINVQDTRFKALFDGTDDRFGIDKTNPSFKPTDSMKMILGEQSKRRKRRKLT